MFKLFGRRKRREIEAEENKNVLIKQIVDLRNAAYEKGTHLLGQPFIPEDLGFDEYIKKDSREITLGRIYHKDGVSITKSADNGKWYIIIGEQKINTEFIIYDMFQAITIFQALGVPGMSIDEFIEKSKKDSEIIDKTLSLDC